MKIILCDDNAVFLRELHSKIKKITAKQDWVCQFFLFQRPQALQNADLSAADVAFLDIDMPGLSGIELAGELHLRYPELLIVFITGFIQYARDGYRVEAFRYLLKDRLDEELPACLRDVQTKLYANQESVSVRQLEYTAQIRLNEILYFEGTARRHVVMHRTGGTAECLGKLGEYETQLRDRGFLRIQRSYLVNMRHIVWMNNYHVSLSDGTNLKISEPNYAEISRQYLCWKGDTL